MRGIHRHRWAWSFSCALCWVGAGVSVELGTAQAQSVHADEPAPAGRTYATGDWGGYRSYLEDRGVTLTLSYINDFLTTAGGGIRPGQIDLGAFQPQLDIDLQKLAGWQGGHIHVHGLVTHGPFFSETYLGNILAVSNLEAGPVARLYALWYEQNAPDDRWSVRTGLMLADSQFAAEQDRVELHQQRHQLADLSRGQPPRLRPGLSVARARRARALQAARRSRLPGRHLQRRSHRRRRLEPAGADPGRHGLQLSRRHVSDRRGELPAQPGQRYAGDCRAPIASAPGITRAPPSPTSATTPSASRSPIRPRRAFRSITPGTAVSTA